MPAELGKINALVAVKTNPFGFQQGLLEQMAFAATAGADFALCIDHPLPRHVRLAGSDGQRIAHPAGGATP